MNYSGIIFFDIANGPGIRTSLFVSGCRNNCPGCFNKEQQNFKYGELFTEEIGQKIIDSVNDDHHDGISILGGDPLELENAEVLVPFLKSFKNTYGSNKSVWMYTGYIWEYINLLEYNDSRFKILNYVDILVDGPFVEQLKDIRLKFRGSSNQRFIDVQKSLKSSKIVTIEL